MWTFRRKFLAAFLLAACAPLATYAVMSFRSTSAALQQQEQRQMHERSAAIVATLQEKGAAVLDQVRSFAPWTVFAHAVDRRDVPWLESNVTVWMNQNTAIHSSQVLGMDHSVVSSAGDFKATSLWNLPVVRAAFKAKRCLFAFQRVKGRIFLVAAGRITRDDGKGPAHGMVVFGEAIDGPMLAQVARTAGVSGLTLYVGAEPVAATSPGAVELPLPPPAVGRVFVRGNQTHVLTELDDTNAAPVGVLEVSVDRSAITVTTATLRRTITYAVLAALAIALTLGLVMASAVSRPLRRLAQAAAAIASGETRQHLDVRSRDEVGRVAQAFNTMSERIAQELDQLSSKIRGLTVEISSLGTVGETLTQAPDVRTELRRLSGMVREIFAADYAALYLLDDGEFRLTASSGNLKNGYDLGELCNQTALAGEAVTARPGKAKLSITMGRTTGQGAGALAVPLLLKDTVRGALAVASSAGDRFHDDDLSLLAAVASQIAMALQNAEAYAKLDAVYLETVTALAAAMEAKDHYTAEHADSLAAMATAVGQRMGLSENDVRQMQYAAVLHDIGKIGIPGQILNKPGKLSDDEFHVMAEHTVIGERIISRIEYLGPIARVIRSAHERWDGGGYPDRIAGEEIPLASRIIFVCDAYHAMTSDRPYRKALPVEEALEELRRNAGTQFDAKVVEVFEAEFAPLVPDAVSSPATPAPTLAQTRGKQSLAGSRGG
jgi:GAF domain-containing protein/sensor domain CHASE-containing protein